jgi:hypothetical protein
VIGCYFDSLGHEGIFDQKTLDVKRFEV